MGKFNSDDYYIYYYGQESLRRNRVALIVNKRVWNAVLGCNLKNDRMISICFQGKSFNITVIQVYTPTNNAEEDLQDFLELTPKKDVLFIIRDWNAKVGSQVILEVTGKFGLVVQNEAGQRLTEFCQETCSLRHNSVLAMHKNWRRQWHLTPVLLPRKSHGRRSLVGCSPWGCSSWTQLSDFTFTFLFHALEKEMATHSSVLAWRIPGTGKPGGLPSMGSHRVGHDWSDLAAAAACTRTWLTSLISWFSNSPLLGPLPWWDKVCICYISCSWWGFQRKKPKKYFFVCTT